MRQLAKQFYNIMSRTLDNMTTDDWVTIAERERQRADTAEIRLRKAMARLDTLATAAQAPMD